MGDVTITVETLVLYDLWPGVAVPPPFPVTDMTSASVGYNVVHPMWPLGTKWELYNYGDQASVGVSYRQGFSTFIYLQGSSQIGAAIAAARGVTGVPEGTLAAADKDFLIYVAETDTDSTTMEYSGLSFVSIGAVTNEYYAWFLCGGVYSVEYIASGAVGDTIDTDDSVNTAGVELQGIILIDTGVGYAVHATNGQTPGVGISLLTDD